MTGATRGIGAAVAKALGEAGAVVVGTATSESGAQGITEALAGHGLTGEGLRRGHQPGTTPTPPSCWFHAGEGLVRNFFLFLEYSGQDFVPRFFPSF